MELEFLGAARTVTGSMHLLHTRRARVLLECGLFQGRRMESFRRNRTLPFDAASVDAAVLSHAHIDHSGCLPMLTRHGFAGEIHATPATRDLCSVMLEDAARIQASDARYINRRIERDGSDMDPVEPLYDSTDVVDVLARVVPLPYHRPREIAPGVTLTFLDAGHVLGSALVVLDVEDGGARKRLVFTGDLGRSGMPILRDPEPVDGAHVLLSESTYGDRTHPPFEVLEEDLVAALERVYERRGKIVIPSFALERAQEILYGLSTLQRQGRLPPFRIYVDSPLTVAITDVFKLHPECYDAEMRDMIAAGHSPFDLERLQYVSDVESSKAIAAEDEPSIIISASGMCEAGRVLHHLQRTVESPRNMVIIVGWQAQHTLGRRIVERRRQVRIFGVHRDLRAEVVVLNGFSAHADQADLIRNAEEARKRGPLEQVILVHGDPPAQDVLRDELRERGFARVEIPDQGDRIAL